MSAEIRMTASPPSKTAPWKAYFSIFRIELLQKVQYRIAALAGAATSIFWGIVEITVYTVFYRYADNNAAGIAAGMTLQQLASYIWLGQFMFLIQPHVPGEFTQKITSGDVGLELCRPMRLYRHWFARLAAINLSSLPVRGAMVILAGILLPGGYRMSLPASPAGFAAMLVSAVGSLLLCTSYGMFVTSVRMNVSWGNGPMFILLLVPGVLSGTYLPLQLWPDFMQKFLLFQPFAGYADLPIRLYIGSLAPSDAVWAVGLQILWSGFFIFLGNLIMNRQLKNIVVQGG